MRAIRLIPERVTTVVEVAALNLAWFLALDLAGVPPELSLVAWAMASPLVLFILTGRLVTTAARRVEDTTCPRRTRAVLGHLRGQIDGSVRVILDCCSRLQSRERAPEETWRVTQEGATIHAEVLRLRETVARIAREGVEPQAPAEPGRGPRQDRRAIVGYLRRASGVANGGGRS